MQLCNALHSRLLLSPKGVRVSARARVWVCVRASVCVCVRVCVCVCVCLVGGPVKNGLRQIRHFRIILYATKKAFNDLFGDVVAHDLDLPFNVQRFESRPFRDIKRDYLAHGYS